MWELVVKPERCICKHNSIEKDHRERKKERKRLDERETKRSLV